MSVLGDPITPEMNGYVEGLAKLMAEKEEARRSGNPLFILRCQIIAGYRQAGDAMFGTNRSATLQRLAAELSGTALVRIVRENEG